MIVNSPSFAKVDAAVGLIVESDDGSTITTGAVDVEPTVSLRGVTRFELFRSRLGRRSWAQVRAYDWSGSDDDIEAVIARWFSFGPSPLPIIE